MQILLAPYRLEAIRRRLAARAEAAMPGAYLKAAFRGSTSVGLVVDGSINRGCPAASMPVIEFSVDEGPFKVVPLTSDEASYVVPRGQWARREGIASDRGLFPSI